MARLSGGTDLRQTRRLALTAGMLGALDILRMTNRELDRFLSEAASANAALVLRRGAITGPGLPPDADNAPAARPSLIAHVLDRIDGAFPAGPSRALALAFAEALEPSGWISTDPGTVARQHGATAAEAQAVLAVLQGFDPPGLFAQSLRECLHIQAREAGLLDDAMAAVLERLDLLAAGRLDDLARRSGIAPARIEAAARTLRRFDPKPGAGFSVEPADLRGPDLIVERGPGGWSVTLNRRTLPTVSVAPGDAADPARRAAQRIADMVSRRNGTLLRLAGELVRRQAAGLDHGRARLVPLRRSDLAEALGLHVSTVSRALAGLSLQTPLGVMPVDDLFPAALGDRASSAQAQDALLRAVAAEDPQRPLSDDALAAILTREGIPAARRTVAKYRAALRIPAAGRRRRR
jgi:RNA polymerase sigma-54 factor